MFPIRDHNPSHKIPLVTYILIALTSYIFFMEITSADIETFILQYALIPSQVNFLDPVTLIPFISSIFLHGGWLHFLSNMWFLWIFGDNVEAALGHITYFLFYLIAGIAGGLLQYIFVPQSDIPMLGASGAIAGVLGGYFVLYPRHKIDTLIPFFGFFSRVQIPAAVMLMYWFAMQFFSGIGSISSISSGGVAFWAHVGGFVTGLLFTRILL